jgi:adenylyltransferase/sulfurtransferase
MLSTQEQTRYQRHLLLKQIGGSGQAKLKQAKVLMVGAGGLGAPCLYYLAAAGVGTIGIIDDDIITLSNLQRQILYKTGELNQLKVEKAKQALESLNPEIKIIAYPERLTKENAWSLFNPYDIIADGSDNFETRFLINDVCHFAKKTLTSAAIGEFSGQLASFRSFDSTAQGANVSWRCFVSEKASDAQNCAQGVMGALCGIMGALQALEIIKQITGAGDNLLNKMMLYDGLSGQSRIIKLRWDKHNPLNGESPTIKREDFCLSE